MSRETRPVIGHVIAQVTFPLREGDRTDGPWSDFIFEEPGVKDGELAVCRVTDVQTLSWKVTDTDGRTVSES